MLVYEPEQKCWLIYEESGRLLKTIEDVYYAYEVLRSMRIQAYAQGLLSKDGNTLLSLDKTTTTFNLIDLRYRHFVYGVVIGLMKQF